MENFKEVKGYEGLYLVSDLGNVYSVKSKKNLKFRDNGKGYNVSAIYKKGKRRNVKTHRLVAEHFLNNKDNKPQVNHINGIKSDNRLVNLEWCTQRENTIHSFENGLQKRKLTHKEVEEIRSNKNSLYQYELADKYGVCKQMISMIINNKRRTQSIKFL